MDWKLLSPVEASVCCEECSQQKKTSTERLCYNLDALLRRDKRDCLSKQLHGILSINARVYKLKEDLIQRALTIEKLENGSKLERAYDCHLGKYEYCKQPSRKYLNSDVDADSEASRPGGGKSRSGTTKRFYVNKSVISRRVSPNFSSSKCKNNRHLQMNLELSGEADVLPSNGWWLDRGSSDSETETELDVDCRASLNTNTKIDDFGSSCSACSSSENSQRSLIVSDPSKNSYHREAELQARKGSFVGKTAEDSRMQPGEQRGEKESWNFLELTSRIGDEDKSCSIVPSPPAAGLVSYDKRIDDKSPSSLSPRRQALCNARDVSISDDNSTFEYGDLLKRYPYTASRITYSTLGTSYGFNCATGPGAGRIIKEYGRFQGVVESRNKTPCLLPKVNNKTTASDYPRSADKRRPNTATAPGKLRFTQRNKSGVCGKLTEDKDTDERLLPTTLNKSADASYSIMTPYMANIVWSVMNDEKVQ